VKLVRFNMEGSQQKVWVLQHDLSSIERPAPKTRPIHLLTFLYASSSTSLFELSPAKHTEMFRLCFALEAKLSAVKHFVERMQGSFLQIQPPDARAGEVVDFESSTIFIAELEAYLNAIYSSLELTNQIVRILDHKVKQGFRSMAKKGLPPFDFIDSPWLQSFYDVRTELCHYGSPLPSIEHAIVVIEITQKHQTHRLEYGKRAKVPIVELLSYEDGLFSMLDEWAVKRLAELDQEVTAKQLIFDRDGRKGHESTVRELIRAHLHESARGASLVMSTVAERGST
jgi:hypothetical protein